MKIESGLYMMKRVLLSAFFISAAILAQGEELPVTTEKDFNRGCVPGCILFVGDSNVQLIDWQSYFDEDVCNYGIGGSTTSDLYAIRYRVYRVRPGKIVMLVGGNDLLRYIDYSTIENNYRKLIRYYRSVTDEVYCISNLPVNPKIYLSNWAIIILNMKLENICKEMGVTYVNAFPHFYLKSGLNPKYALDDVHINEEGHRLLVSVLKNHL